jgi:hypothetical protein
MSTRTGIEAVLAVASIALGIAGAALVHPVILGIAAAVAVVATVLRLTDKTRNAKIAG